MSYASEWRGLAYWICTFSISQWKVKVEVGNGTWQAGCMKPWCTQKNVQNHQGKFSWQTSEFWRISNIQLTQGGLEVKLPTHGQAQQQQREESEERQTEEK